MIKTHKHHQEPTLLIPFIHHSIDGEIETFYEPNTDPIKAGLDAMKGINFKLEESIGYPTMHARIVYHSSGIRTSMAWIQIITDYFNANVEAGQEKIFIDIDVSPTFRDLGVPFYSYGNLPEIFDAPSNNIGNYSTLKWVADTFLTTLPDRTNDHTISFLAGFRWGYIECARELQKPVAILPLQIIDGSYWNSKLHLLREQFPAWNYRES